MKKFFGLITSSVILAGLVFVASPAENQMAIGIGPEPHNLVFLAYDTGPGPHNLVFLAYDPGPGPDSSIYVKA